MLENQDCLAGEPLLEGRYQSGSGKRSVFGRKCLSEVVGNGKIIISVDPLNVN
jgi:hypothetical protein